MRINGLLGVFAGSAEESQKIVTVFHRKPLREGRLEAKREHNFDILRASSSCPRRKVCRVNLGWALASLRLLNAIIRDEFIVLLRRRWHPSAVIFPPAFSSSDILLL